MNAVIRKQCASQGVRIPNEQVDTTAEDNKIIIKKAVLKKHITLEERLKDFNGEYAFEECDWGKPVDEVI